MMPDDCDRIPAEPSWKLSTARPVRKAGSSSEAASDFHRGRPLGLLEDHRGYGCPRIPQDHGGRGCLIKWREAVFEQEYFCRFLLGRRGVVFERIGGTISHSMLSN